MRHRSRKSRRSSSRASAASNHRATKRDAQGADGIVAEDIGKFPDTNLASLAAHHRRIDRSLDWRGSKVTVRGVGPDFNLVLLNGRQMPASSIQDTGASNSRAFDFANLASKPSVPSRCTRRAAHRRRPAASARPSTSRQRVHSAPGLRTSFA
jgi:hypothetical protein